MSLKLGTQDISGISQNTKYNAHHLLDFKWSDCIMNDVSWLRADTFSWQSGDVYVSAYNHLVADLQGTTAETETIGSYTVTFYRADDGHKICLADQEATVLNIYNESGIAWYYILDTTNTRFKLPRTKFGFEGLRNKVGDLIEAGLPNIWYSNSGYTSDPTIDGALKQIARYDVVQNETTRSGRFIAQYSFDASRCSSIYGNSTTVQEQATQMYLYFYVGEFTQTATEQTAGLNSELFNNKADTDLGNLTDTGKILMANASMPSNTYDVLTLGASGTTYTAPADGWVIVQKVANSNQQITIIGHVGSEITLVSNQVANFNGQWIQAWLPVSKGSTYSIEYNASGATQLSRFIYAQGSESEGS